MSSAGVERLPGLTARQTQVLLVIYDYFEEHHVAPSLATTAAALGLQPTSKGTVSDRIKLIVAAGYLQKTSRGFIPTEKADRAIRRRRHKAAPTLERELSV